MYVCVYIFTICMCVFIRIYVRTSIYINTYKYRYFQRFCFYFHSITLWVKCVWKNIWLRRCILRRSVRLCVCVCGCIHEVRLYLHIYIYKYFYVRVCIYLYVRILVNTFIYIYIYTKKIIYTYMYVYVFGKHLFVNTHFIKQYRYPLSTHFCIYPFESPHWFYVMRQKLVEETLIINGFYCKSDVTIACTLLFCKCWAFIIYTGVFSDYS